MTDEDARLNLELFQNGEHIVGIAFKSGVALKIEVFGIGSSGANVIEEDNSVFVDEMRNKMLPQRLIAAEAMGEHDDLLP